uniref:Family with sequence similarity 122B n=2 Tax=Eptatretus burgeri TaxID=7764 RepID=A0A8C4QS83_EPTBU
MDPGMDDNGDHDNTDSGSPDSSLEDPGVSGRLPDLGSTESGGLWRCNSAPTIAGFGGRISPLPERGEKLEGRRLSYSPSLMNWQTTPMPLSPVRMLSSRVNQIKQEEGGDVMNRETAHERGVQAAMQISQSWDSVFTLGDPSSDSEKPLVQRRLENFPLSPSPSPTRGIGKQLFSPSLQTSVNTSPASSPRRFTMRRSLSPIGCLRAGGVGSNKRKAEGDIELPAKRSFLSAGESSSPDCIAPPSSFLHSPSGSSLESESESPSMPPRLLSLSSDPDQIQTPILASAFIPVSR